MHVERKRGARYCGRSRARAQWPGWTFLVLTIHVSCVWCHSSAWPLLVSMMNTRAGPGKGWVNSWRYFSAKCTPLSYQPGRESSFWELLER